MASKRDEDAVTEGSGNVFADLGVAEPEEELAKAQLAGHIREAIKRRKLTQGAARCWSGSISRKSPRSLTDASPASPATGCSAA